MRKRETSTSEFRSLLAEISMLLAYEVTRELPTHEVAAETPVGSTTIRLLDGKKIVLISILRAGNGLLDGMLNIVPSARVGHVGLYRDPATLQAVEYYLKVPEDIGSRLAIVLDPLLAAPEWVAELRAAHPDVPLYTAAIDSHLNDHGYIVPGLGDAGDRLFGTK